MRTPAPAGTSHSSAARSPCQRTEYDTGPELRRRVPHVERRPRHSCGHAPSSATSVPLASTSALRTANRGIGRRPPQRVVARRPRTRDRTVGEPPCVGNMPRRTHAAPRLGVEAPVLERDDHLGIDLPRLPREQELRAGRVDRGLQLGSGKLDPHPPVELGAATRARPPRRAGTAVGVEPRRSAGSGQARNRRRVRCATGNRKAASRRAAPVAARARTASSRAPPLVTTCAGRAVVGHRPPRRRTECAGSRADRRRSTVAPSRSTCARAPHDERDDERRGRLVDDLDHAPRRRGAVHVLHRVAPGHAHRGLHHRHAVDQRLADGRLSSGRRATGRRRRSTSRAPSPRARARARRRRRRWHRGRRRARRSTVVDRRLRTRAAVTDRPWSSAFASRSMSSGTSSAGRRPS